MSRSQSPSSPGPSAISPSKSTKPQRGVSIFPTARVARIVKADRDVDICSKEATFLISIATEIFVKKLTDEAYTNAKLDKRKHVFYKDLSRAVQQNDYLEFLKDAIPTPIALSAALDARQDKLQQKQTEENMILEGTLQDQDEPEDEDDDQQEQDDDQDDDGNDDENENADEDAPEDDQDDPAQAAAKASTKSPASKSKSKSNPIDTHPEHHQEMDQDDD